jgi:hypothetical protein
MSPSSPSSSNGSFSDRLVYERAQSSASSTSSSDIAQCAASSATVAERPSSWASVPAAPLTRAVRSCRPRRTCTDQVWSRKWRLISPDTVGTANVLNRSPRSTSNRSTAFTSPTAPTWSRSSSGSPR